MLHFSLRFNINVNMVVLESSVILPPVGEPTTIHHSRIRISISPGVCLSMQFDNHSNISPTLFPGQLRPLANNSSCNSVQMGLPTYLVIFFNTAIHFVSIFALYKYWLFWA